jgi:hypothetical protein
LTLAPPLPQRTLAHASSWATQRKKEEEEKEEEKESSYINHAVCNSHFNDHQIQFIWW